MDGFPNSNGGPYNGQLKQFVSAPSVEIKFERENDNDVNSISPQQYRYGDLQYQQPIGQEYNTATNAGLQPVPAQDQIYYGSEVTPISAGKDFTPRKVSPETNNKITPLVSSSLYSNI